MKRKKKTQTTQEALDDVAEAWREFVLEVSKALHLDRLLDWITARLNR